MLDAGRAERVEDCVHGVRMPARCELDQVSSLVRRGAGRHRSEVGGSAESALSVSCAIWKVTESGVPEFARGPRSLTGSLV